MAWHVPLSTTSNVDIALRLSDGDDAFIAKGVLLSSSYSQGIFGEGSGHHVIVAGTVVSTVDAAVRLGNAPSANNQILTVDAGGELRAFGTWYAAELVGYNSQLINNGLIFGIVGAVHVSGENTTTTTRVTNNGSMISDGIGISVSFFATETVSFINTGSVSALTAYRDQSSAGVRDVITNTGSIVGQLLLGGGNDTYNGATGHLLGQILGEAGNDTITTGIGNNTLDGGAGNDTLEGGLGADSLIGGIGNDTYVLANDTTDTIIDTGGLDIITSTVSRALTNTSIENLFLLGTASISGVGNAAVNVIIGNTGNNGLNGGANNDTLLGGAGTDTLIGGLGNDSFRFASTTHSLVAAPDVIIDFDDFGDDRIDVSALFGPAMAYRHNLAFTAAGQVRINDIVGADLLVEVNTGGTLAPDLAIRLSATTLASMTATDFVL